MMLPLAAAMFQWAALGVLPASAAQRAPLPAPIELRLPEAAPESEPTALAAPLAAESAGRLPAQAAAAVEPAGVVTAAAPAAAASRAAVPLSKAVRALASNPAQDPRPALDRLYLGRRLPEAAADAASAVFARLPFVGAHLRKRAQESAPFFELMEREGHLFFVLKPQDLGKPFLLSATLERGLGEKDFPSAMSSGLEFLAYFRRVADHVELVSKNTKYRAPEGAPLERTMTEAAPDSPVAKAQILRERGGRLIVAADELFARDLFDWGDELSYAYRGDYKLDQDLSRVQQARGYPRNVELASRLSFVRAASYGWTRSHLNDTRTLPLTMRYSLSALPEPGYRSRDADERVGFFTTTYQDWSDDQAPELDRNVINRWRLEKTDPAAAVSPVKKPIVYWIDPSVPEQYRGAIARAVLTWNKAFERAGFKDAVEVRVARSGEDFDPADARRNVIRYYLERDSGYAVGPSRANPMTGEIYNAGVAISASHPRSPLAGVVPRIDLDENAAPSKGRAKGPCRYAEQAAQDAAFTLELLEARGGMTEEERRKFIEDYVTDLVLHEVGHTLGLRHNFAAKAWRPNAELGEHRQFTASVMDYAPINLAPPGRKQGAFWTTDLGPYDYWAIEYGYKDLPEGSERAELAKIAGRSSEPGLRFMTDEDVSGLDPTAQPWSLGSDALEFSRGRVALVRELWDRLEKKAADGVSAAKDLYRPMLQGWAIYRQAVDIAVSHVGGLIFTRAAQGRPAYEPVAAAQQRRTLDFLAKAVFSDEPLALSSRLLSASAPGRMPTAAREAPDLDYFPYNKLVLWLRRAALSRLLSDDTLERITESGNLLPAGADRLTVSELFNRLTDSIFSDLKPRAREAHDPDSLDIGAPRRQLQMDYVDRLIEIGFRGSDEEVPEASTAAKAHLRRLLRRVKDAAQSKSWDAATRDHLTELARKISRSSEHYVP